MEGAEPAGLDKLWWGRSCPRHPGVQAPGTGEAILLGIFCREGTGHWGQGIHQCTKGKQGNTQDTRDGRNHSTS